jgi:hypothetical protein
MDLCLYDWHGTLQEHTELVTGVVVLVLAIKDLLHLIVGQTMLI